jgi:hypothetical protein
LAQRQVNQSYPKNLFQNPAFFCAFFCFPRLTKAKRHLNRIYTVSHGGRYETEKKVSEKRMVSGSDGGDAFFQRGGFYAAAPWQGF